MITVRILLVILCMRVLLFVVGMTNNISSTGLDADCPESWWLDVEDECRNYDERNFKVLFGDRTSPKRYPYLASLQIPILRNTGCYLHWCGATFIGHDLVITAAHCIWGEEQDWRDLNNKGKLNQVAYIAQAPLCKHQQGYGRQRVARYWLPEQYNPQGAGWDIAILQLEQPSTVTHFVQFEASNTVDLGEQQLTIAGWGASQPNESKYNVVQMKAAYLEQISPQECESNLLKQAGLKGPYNWQEEFCAFSMFTDACGGDSGGPILVSDQDGDDPSRDIQVGVISWGPQKACTDSKIQFPGIYTRIDTKIDWIKNVISESQQFATLPEMEGLEESEKDCSISEAGCECQQSDQEFGGYTLVGCSNPDNDPMGNWCLIDVTTCRTTAVGISWDYCQEGC